MAQKIVPSDDAPFGDDDDVEVIARVALEWDSVNRRYVPLEVQDLFDDVMARVDRFRGLDGTGSFLTSIQLLPAADVRQLQQDMRRIVEVVRMDVALGEA